MRRFKKLWANSDGAVAPTVALSLTGLIAAGSIAFDYARLASMDTELQDAADQAALAGAAQLDGQANACARAAAAASAMVANKTMFANDNSNSTAINVQNESGCDATGQIKFYQGWNQATDAPLAAATTNATAKVISVQVDNRQVFYALTPIVAAIAQPAVHAVAVASLSSAICKVPPVMLCNPKEATDPDFTINNYVGKGLKLLAKSPSAPGDFGFLQTTLGPGKKDLRIVMGQTITPGDCVEADGVTTEPGDPQPALDALNTRFDIYVGNTNLPCDKDGSLCLPSANTRKDLVKNTNGNCGNNSWNVPANPYLPPSNAALTDAQADALSPMGYPRDICHAVDGTTNGACGGRFGDGVWDVYAYFRSHRSVDYPEVTSRTALNTFLNNTFGTTTPTRYQVYKWEMQNAATRLKQENLSGNKSAFSVPVCTTPGVSPSSTQADRRVLTVAVVNCGAESVNGRTPDVTVTRWIDVFLVEPSVSRSRTSSSDVYVEVIGENKAGGGNNAPVVRRDVPYLLR